MEINDLFTYKERGFRLYPIHRTLRDIPPHPADLYERLGWQGHGHFLLESGKMGECSFIGGDPFAVLIGKDQDVTWMHRGGHEHLLGNPLDILKEKMAQYQAPRLPHLPKFRGGAVGMLSYDMIRYIERMPESTDDDLQTPDLYMLFVDELCVVDHQTGEVHLIVHLDLQADDLEAARAACEQRLDELEHQARNGASRVPAFEQTTTEGTGELERSISERDFCAAVEAVQEYIRAGDVFQVNLSVRQGRALGAAPYEIYRHLREINPSPYSSYIHLPELQIVSSSPELLVGCRDGKVDTRPIAGTRARTGDDARDRLMLEELRTNEKEIAEHIMLVDLERNDLGRVCRYGSVEVNELMVIEEYSHVYHIVSNVRGELAEGKDAYDLIRATFPGGTITGAPKIRTMEIIEELEPTRRGLYTGSIGWIDFDGDMELNIVIRTLQVQNGKGYVQAGAGIVIDSIPEREYKESLRKAKAVWVAIEAAEAKKREEEAAR